MVLICQERYCRCLFHFISCFKTLAQYELSDTKMEPCKERLEFCIYFSIPNDPPCDANSNPNQSLAAILPKRCISKGRFSKVVRVGDDLFPHRGFLNECFQK